MSEDELEVEDFPLEEEGEVSLSEGEHKPLFCLFSLLYITNTHTHTATQRCVLIFYSLCIYFYMCGLRFEVYGLRLKV